MMSPDKDIPSIHVIPPASLGFKKSLKTLLTLDSTLYTIFPLIQSQTEHDTQSSKKALSVKA